VNGLCAEVWTSTFPAPSTARHRDVRLQRDVLHLRHAEDVLEDPRRGAQRALVVALADPQVVADVRPALRLDPRDDLVPPQLGVDERRPLRDPLLDVEDRRSGS